MELSKHIPTLEAILFAGGEPVPTSRLAAALGLTEEKTEKAAVLLGEKLNSPDSGIELLRLGDGWQLATKKQYEEPIRTVFELRRSTPLSSAAFEVLAVVAYNQPVTKAYVEQVRGVDCSGVISSLVLKGLIEECGRLDFTARQTPFCGVSDWKICPNFRPFPKTRSTDLKTAAPAPTPRSRPWKISPNSSFRTKT